MLPLFPSTLKNPDSTKNTNVFWAAIQHSSYFFLGFQWIVFFLQKTNPSFHPKWKILTLHHPPQISNKIFVLTISAEPRLAKFTIFVHHQMLHKVIHPTFSFHRHPRTPNPDQVLAGWWWQWSWLRAALGVRCFLEKKSFGKTASFWILFRLEDTIRKIRVKVFGKGFRNGVVCVVGFGNF